MRASQDLRYLLRCLLGHTLGYCRAGDAPKICLGKDALHDRGVRSEGEVVLVHAHRVVALLLEHAHHTERDAVEAHHTSHGVRAVGAEVVYDGLTEHTHLGAGFDVGLGEHLAIADRELTNVEIVEVNTIDA